MRYHTAIASLCTAAAIATTAVVGSVWMMMTTSMVVVVAVESTTVMTPTVTRMMIRNTRRCSLHHHHYGRSLFSYPHHHTSCRYSSSISTSSTLFHRWIPSHVDHPFTGHHHPRSHHSCHDRYDTHSRRFFVRPPYHTAATTTTTTALPQQSRKEDSDHVDCTYDNSNHNSHDNQNRIDDDRDDEHMVRDRTYQWVRRVVIGLNLCPFAQAPTASSQLRIVVVRGNHVPTLMEYVVQEIRELVATTITTTTTEITTTTTTTATTQQQQQPHTTTLVVCPECYPQDFLEYLNLVHDVEEQIGTHPEWDGIVQLASFHPHYCFSGSDDSADPDNCTNQSPYPIFHLLREIDVTRAVQQLPDQNAAGVWSRNVDLLRTLHRTFSYDDFTAIVTVPKTTTTTTPPPQEATSWLASDNQIDEEEGLDDDDDLPKDTPQQQERTFQVRQILRRFPIPLMRGTTHGEIR
jgi:uncharacterized protein